MKTYISQSAPKLPDEEYKRRVNLLLNELIDIGLEVIPASEDDWANFVAGNESGVRLKIGLDDNGLKIQYQINFELPNNGDLRIHANSLNSLSKVSRIVCLAEHVFFNAFYPLTPSGSESEFSVFITLILDDVQIISEYIQDI